MAAPRWYRRASFSTRFAIVLTVLGILVAASTAAISVADGVGRTRDLAVQRASDRAGLAANLVAAQRSSLTVFIRGFAQDVAPPVLTRSRPEVTRAVVAAARSLQQGDILQVDMGGTTVVRVAGMPDAPAPAPTLETLSAAAARQGDNVVAGSRGEPWLLASSQVAGGSGRTFIARQLTAAVIGGLQQTVTSSGSDVADVAVLRFGRYVLPGHVSGAPVGAGGRVDAAVAAVLDGAARTYSVDGADWAAASAPLGGGFQLLVTSRSAAVPGVLATVLGPVGIVALLMILVALGVVFLMVQRDLTGPLHRLDRAVEALAREDYDVPVPAQRHGELGRLAASFEVMRGRLRTTLSGAQARAAIASELNGAASLRDALADVLIRLCETTGASCGSVMLAGDDGAGLSVGHRLSRPVDAGDLLEAGGAVGSAYRAGSACAVIASTMPRSPERRIGMKEVCAAPLWNGRASLGVIVIADKATGFRRVDSELLIAAAEQVALAVERDRVLAMMQHAATTDALTGLHNLRYLVEALDRQLALAERQRSALSILLLDLDHFKEVNDRHGHPSGDLALQAFAHTLTDSIRRSDLAARYGGEEFVVVMANTDREEARIVAEKIRAAVRGIRLHFSGPGSPVGVSVSIGGAVAHPGVGARELLEQADRALYRAKQSGRDRVCFIDDPASAA